MTVGDRWSATRRIEIGPCPPGRACGIVVGSEDVAAAPAAVVGFRSGPGAGYDLRRTMGGIAVAAGFLVMAWWLWRRTDWSPPTEAATPELDRSELW